MGIYRDQSEKIGFMYGESPLSAWKKEVRFYFTQRRTNETNDEITNLSGILGTSLCISGRIRINCSLTSVIQINFRTHQPNPKSDLEKAYTCCVPMSPLKAPVIF